MSLKYDFDIHSVLPETVMDNPDVAKMMGDIGFNFNSRSNYVALFRDPATVEALRGADEVVQEYFKTSGFGFNIFDSGAGPGKFPAKDEPAVNDVLKRLGDNLQEFDLNGKNWNGFEISKFLEHVVTMKPVDMAPAGDPFSTPSLPGSGGMEIDEPNELVGTTPLDRVRARHTMAAASPEDTAAFLDTPKELPKPDVDVDPDRARRLAASDRMYRLKRGLPLVAGGLLLFVFAIIQGRNLSADNESLVTLAQPDPAAAAAAE